MIEVVAEELERIFALYAGHGFFDVVLDVLREVEVDAGKLFEAVLHRRDELGLCFRETVDATGDAGLRSARNFDVVEGADVGAVVGAAHLRDDLGDLGDRAHVRRESGRRVSADCWKEMSCCMVARIQRLPSSSGGMNSPPTNWKRMMAPRRASRAAMVQVSLLKRSDVREQTVVVFAEEAAEPGVRRLLLDSLGHGERAEHRSEDQREDERAGERESVGDGHGSEDFSGHALHGEERNEGDEDDEGGEEDGTGRVG